MTKKRTPAPEADRGHKARLQNSPYDKIWRENMEAALPGIIKKVLGIDIVHSENLQHKIQVTKQKEVDFLKKVTDQKGNTFILHIEAQTVAEQFMAYRMLEYRFMITQIYRLPVRQYVLFLGETASGMPAGIDLPDLKYRYNLIVLNKIPYQLFLSSPYPQEKILAVLGDFGEENAQKVLEQVISETRKVSGTDFAENQYLQQLRVIIQLRNLAKEFNNAMESVAKFFRKEKDPFFIEGELKGKMEGKIEGKVEGKTEGKVEVVRNLLQSGRFTIAEIAHFANVDEAFVEKVRDAFL